MWTILYTFYKNNPCAKQSKFLRPKCHYQNSSKEHHPWHCLLFRCCLSSCNCWRWELSHMESVICGMIVDTLVLGYFGYHFGYYDCGYIDMFWWFWDETEETDNWLWFVICNDCGYFDTLIYFNGERWGENCLMESVIGAVIVDTLIVIVICDL